MVGFRSPSQAEHASMSEGGGDVLPSVTVVIAAWNAQDTIRRAVNSALTQENVALQVIVVDDMSDDGTRAMVRSIDDQRVVLLESEVNRGPAAARNLGFARAEGDYIAVLDADDYMLPGRLAQLVDMAVAANADIVADNMLLHRDDTGEQEIFFRKEELGTADIGLSRYFAENLMFDQRRALGYLKPVFRTAFVRAHALAYDPRLRVGEDFMLIAEALALGGRYVVSPHAGYVYTVSKSGSISNRLSLPKLRAMIDSNHAFERRHAATLKPDERAAFGMRTRSLDDALHFLETIEHVKARRVLAALKTVLTNPRSARHFRMTVRLKLRQLKAALAGRARPA